VIARFYPIVDTAAVAARGGNTVLVAKTLLTAGVRMLQYRHKDNWTQREYDDAAHIAELCRAADAQFVLNDRADYARLFGCGVHLGQDDLPPLAARKVVGDASIGFSTHNKRQLTMGDEEPVQYLAIGPIFPTTSKLKPDPVIGLDRLRGLRALTKKSLVAIGGIALENAGSVFEAGVDSVSILSGFLPDDCDPAEISKRSKLWLSI
jgi:thiamine-phosphate pyrophosphorylase